MSSAVAILIVEDNPLNLKLVRDVLLHAGFDVVEARTGEEGVARAQDEPTRPDPDGPAAAGHRRHAGASADQGRPSGADVPVVALTAFAMAEDRERALLDGFDGYLSKPISVRDLPAPDRRVPARSGAPMTETSNHPGGGRPAANLRLLDAVLSPRGYRVITASSGEQALELLPSSRHRPGAARHRDAGHRRVRGVPTDPRATRVPRSFRS